ncbi:glycosyltransferase family 4 protein [Arvimicrobium flavum]|uniref:glycosyltransferase family 4 protein n=1 Tax=Arvimicrobium flavum TaxID=3393320 RepID=UPI00237B1302|nr:glycosyltransferase family 4 protein [Mesorhizobium shangrilense]
MRVVFVLAGFGAGGAEKVVNLVAHHRLEQGDAVHVIAASAPTTRSYFPYDSEISLETLQTRGTTRIGLVWLRAAELRRRIRELQPDVVISFLSKINILVGLAAIGLDTPVIMSERNNYQAQKMSPFWRLLAPVAARSAAHLVMQTAAARNALPRALEAKAVVIPNPVSIPANVPRNSTIPPRFVAVGRLEEQKGFDLLIAAFSHVVQRLPSATLSIFGEGPERPGLERQVRTLGLADRVSLPGVTNSPGDWLSQGDIFVLSSRFEGFPNVLLEALMARMATVAFDCPWGPAEILQGDAGLLVPAGDVHQLAETLLRVATDPVLADRLAERGPAVTAGYSKPAVFAQWDAVIAAVVSGRGKPQA